MYQDLRIFQTAGNMARHAGARQSLTAQNVANADTPGYRAIHLPSFSQAINESSMTTMNHTRAGHFSSPSLHNSRAGNTIRTEPSPNGNAVSLEQEMLNGAEITREHSRALAVYRHAMTVLRTTLGR